jgi:hypothetical protein
MHLLYIDESMDEKTCVISALAVPSESWQDTFRNVKEWRRGLRRTDGVFVHKELHAWKLVSGRGDISDRVVTKYRRCQILVEALELLASLEGLRLFNAVARRSERLRLFERLLNRINRTMETWDSRAVLIIDEGYEVEYTRLTRKLHVYNPIPSSYGTWADTGKLTRNIPIERIIEDPFFKRSGQSYFLQLADFCGYSLLRRENPIPSKTRYGLDKAFGKLAPILVLQASRTDPEGIVRV